MDDRIIGEIAVSIIVPIYNVEKHLEQCLSSIINQSFKNIEIILLNDGATDNSLAICNIFKNTDDRILIYSHENRGLGETRNRGIRIAKGNYLFFVDSDDYLAHDCVESLYAEAMRTGADVVQGESVMFYEESGEKKLEVDLSHIGEIRLNQSSSFSFFRDIFFTHIYKHYAWNKLYKSSFVKRHGILFGDNKKIFAEDTWFQLQFLHYCPHISFTTGSYYYYRQHSSSIMHAAKKDLLSRQATMLEDYLFFIRKNNGSDLERKIAGMISMDVFTMEALNQININGNYKLFKSSLNNLHKYAALYKSVCNFNSDKAFKLEKNPFRNMYLCIVSLMYKYHLDNVALFTIWTIYRIRRG